MRIEWNKVTLLSKIAALAVFVLLSLAGFYFGVQYGAALQAIHDEPVVLANFNTSADYYSNVAAWQSSSVTDSGYTIAYPIDFDVQEGIGKTPDMDWRLDANGVPGIKSFVLTIPRAFEPQTNFADGTLTVGESGNASAVADCLMADPNGGPASGMTTSTVIINGAAFTVFHSADAGAGNYYETTSYRTVHAGECWAIEYTIHSSQIANYPASYELRPFDRAMVEDVLDRIVGTFKFL